MALALGNLTVRLKGLAAADNRYLLTVLDLFQHVRQRDVIEQVDRIVIRRIGKGQRDDTGVDQICLVDTRERLAQYGLDAQIQRNERCMLTGRALTVVCAADNYAAALLLAAGRELRIDVDEAVVGVVRHVRAVRQQLCTGRQDVVGGDVVLGLENDLAGVGCFERLAQRERLDVRAANDLNLSRILGRLYDHVVVDGEMLRHFDLRHLAEGARIGQHTGQCRRCCNLRRYEEDLCILGAGTALKVAVEGTQRYAAGLRRLAHADAGTAGAFKDTRTGRNDIRQSAILRQHIEYLLGTGADGQRNLRAYGLALEDGSDLHHVVVRRVGARTDAALVYLDLADLGYLLDVIRHVRHSCQRLECRQVYGVLLVVLCIRVGGQRYPYVAATLCFEELLGCLVGREDRGGSTQLSAHIGDGGALRYGQGLYALACVLYDLADAALDGHLAQYVQNNVLRRYPRRQLAGQVDADHLRHRDVVRAAAHCDCNVQTAGTERQHADAAAGRRMAVRTDQGLARCAEALQMHLMADAVACLRIVDAVLLSDRTDIFVVVRILEAGLQGIVVNVSDRALGLDLIDAHRLKLEISHRAGGILRQRLIDLKADLLTQCHFAVYQVRFQNLLRDCHTHVCFLRSFMSRRESLSLSRPILVRMGGCGFHSLLHGVTHTVPKNKNRSGVRIHETTSILQHSIGFAKHFSPQ